MWNGTTFYALPPGVTRPTRKLIADLRKQDRKAKKRMAMLVRKGPIEALVPYKDTVAAIFADQSVFVFRSRA